MNNVFIAGSTTVFPQPLSAIYIADKLYPTNLCSEQTNKLAKRAARKFGIKERSICLDLERIPERVLATREHHPMSWCLNLIEQLSKSIPLTEIGYIGLTYNISFHTNTLPNLASQAIIHSGIVPTVAPEEFVNYGCAAGFFPLNSAIKYCQHNEKAAIVIAFDQCSARIGTSCYDPNDPIFEMDMTVSLLFSDGAAALLIIPESMKDKFPNPLPKVENLFMDFHVSDIIRFDERSFVLDEQVKNLVPSLVADSVIKPTLFKHSLLTNNILEWSIHQGGTKVLSAFAKPEILGLSNAQIARSKHFFENFGNMSSPSCFLVFDSFFKEQCKDKRGELGMIVGFGSGLYQFSLLYRWT
jgi:predicted naringenin-chalcone synthase